MTTGKPLLTVTEKHTKWDMVVALSKNETHCCPRSDFLNYNMATPIFRTSLAAKWRRGAELCAWVELWECCLVRHSGLVVDSGTIPHQTTL